MVSSLMFPVGKGVILSVFWLAIPRGYILGSPSVKKTPPPPIKKKKQVRNKTNYLIEKNLGFLWYICTYHIKKHVFFNTLPETNIAHENPIFPDKYHQNGGFSMAMLVYRSVFKKKNPG